MRSIAPLAGGDCTGVRELLAFGRASLSPFGNVFLLARVIYDGPGMDALRRDCPPSGWRLCAFVDRLPANADDFLWRPDGPVAHAGGAKLLSGEADAIIAAAVFAEPGSELRAFGGTRSAACRFATGDGLQPWPATVTPVIRRDFPRFECRRTPRRARPRELAVPGWMQALHMATRSLASRHAVHCC